MDAVVCGHDRDYVGAARVAATSAPRARSRARRRPSCEELVRSPELRGVPARALRAPTTAANPASSTRVERVMLLAEPPSLDANEITDKGYVNQRAALERRARARRPRCSPSSPARR